MPKVGLIFKFQTRGLETYGQYSMDLGIILYLFFSFTRPVHSRSHTRKKIPGTEKIAAEMNNFLCFIFVFL